MKKLTIRLLCLALCLGVLVSLVPAVSAESEETQKQINMEGTAVEQIQPATGGAVGTPVRISGETQWNPLLGEAPEETGAIQNQQVDAAPDKGYIFYDETPFADVLDYICQQMKQRKATFSVTYYTTDRYDYNTFWTTMFEYALSHTGVGNEGDYLRWIWRKRTPGLYGYEGQYITYTYGMTYLTTATQEAWVDTEVAKLINTLNLNSGTDYQKVKRLYDWMCSNITYDHTGLAQTIDNSPLTWTAYKALRYGTCVCQGYASLFYRVMLECGVDTRIIAGNPQAPHAWNIVKLGSYYYNLDSTWDAEYTQAGRSYRYFLCSPANFNSDHIRYDEYDTSDFHYYYPMSSKNYVAGAAIPGDMDGNERLTTDDAVRLLLNIMFGSGDYPVPASANRDTNGDGKVTTDDAVHLLLHVMFGATDYPLAA